MNNLKTKVDDVDVDKSNAVLVDLKKPRDVVDNEVVKSTKFNTLKTKLKSLEKKILDILIHINHYVIDK